MELIDEPEGWQALQEQAQRAKDTQSLAFIIDQMNRLLDSHDWIAAHESPRPPSRGEMPQARITLEAQRPPARKVA